MSGIEKFENLYKYLNSILLTFIGLMLTYGTATIHRVSTTQNSILLEIAVLEKILDKDNVNHIYWQKKIELNEKEIGLIKIGAVSATNDRITKTEVNEELQIIKNEINQLKFLINKIEKGK